MKSKMLRPVLYAAALLSLIGAAGLVAQEMPLKGQEISTIGREISLTPEEVARRRAEKDATIAAMAQSGALGKDAVGPAFLGKLSDPLQSAEGGSPIADGNPSPSTPATNAIPVDTTPEKAPEISTVETGPTGLTVQERAKRAALGDLR